MRIRPLLLQLILGTILGLALVRLVSAQINDGDRRWQAPVIVYSESSTADWRHNQLTMAPDPFGNLHLMWRAATRTEPSEGLASYYSRWNGVWWTEPVDVLISPHGDRFSGATFAVDDLGRLHAIWSGAAEYSLYYSWSWFDQAHEAHNWSDPLAIGPRSFAQMILAEGESNLYIIFTDSGRNVFAMSSQDAGASWTSPVALTSLPSSRTANNPRLLLDDQGILHAVWSEGPPDGYPPLGVFYSKSLDDNISWSTPRQLLGEDIGEPNLAQAGDSTLHLFANGRVGVGGRFHTWSADYGQSWSPVEDLDPRGQAGLTAPISLAIDSSGTLHVLYITEDPVDSGLIYTYWTGSRLAPALRLVDFGTEWFGEGAIISTMQGDQLHMAVPSNGYRWLWHSWKQLDEATPIAAASPAPRTVEEIVPAAIETPGQTSPALAAQPLPEQLTQSPPNMLEDSYSKLFISVIPPLLLIAAVVGYRFRQKR